MRVKLRGSAESAEQQSPGWKGTRSGLWNPGLRIGFRLSPVRAMQTAPPLQGLYPFHSNPGFRPLRGLHPGLCCSALSALVPLALTRMPVRDLPGFSSCCRAGDVCDTKRRLVRPRQRIAARQHKALRGFHPLPIYLRLQER